LWRLSRPSLSLANRPERRGRKRRVMTTMSAKLKLSFENLLVETEKRYGGGGGAGGGGGVGRTFEAEECAHLLLLTFL